MGLKDLQIFAQEEAERANQSQAVNQSLTRGLDENPDEYAKLLKISAQTGIAPSLAKDFRPELEKRQKLQALSVDDLVRSNPKTAKFLANPDNAAVAQDDVQNLSVLEQVLIKPIDYTRSAAEGVVGKGAGSLLSGAGELYGVASRSLESLLDKALPNSVMSVLRTPVPWFMDPEQVLKRPGQTLKQAGEFVAPPKERQGLDTDVASGIGQLGFQIASYLATGGAVSSFSLYAQGADVVATKTAKDKGTGPLADVLGMTPGTARDTAIVGGAAITALTEKYGLDKILNRVPPEIKNRTLRFIADKVAAGGIEAGQEIVEGLLHDLTRKVLTEENAPILEGALKEGTAAALSAAIVRSALGVRGYREAKQQEEVVKALSGDSKLRDRLPEKYQEFVAGVTENGPVQNAYIPVEQFNTFFQSQGVDPQQVADEIGASNYLEALAAGSEVVIPIDKFAANVAPTDYLQGLIPDLKFNQGSMTPRERQEWMAEMDAREADLESQMQALVDEQTRQGGINQVIQEIVTDIEGQLRGAGYDASTAQSSATVMRGMAILAERDLRGRAQAEGREVTDEEIVTAARALWDKYGLTTGRQMPGVLATRPTSDITIDPLLDSLRAGAFPTDQQIFGRSLAEFVRDSGGLVPSGETLTADENMERRPFQKKLTQKDGMALDKALEAAVQAGYFPGMTPGDLTEADFLNALDDDLRGSGVFSINVTDNNALAMREAMNQLSGYLDSLGIDLRALDNRQVRALIEQARNTPELEGVIGQLDQLIQQVTGQDGQRLFQFAGQRAKTADMYALVTAQERIAKGEPAERVRKETGWFLGVDGMWRFEIADDEAKFNNAGIVTPDGIADDVLANVTIGVDDTPMSPATMAVVLKSQPDWKPLTTATYKQGTQEQLKAYGHTEADAIKNLISHLVTRRNKGAFDITKVKVGDTARLGDVLDHPKLFAAYPDLANMQVSFVNSSEYRGVYSPRDDQIGIAVSGDQEQMLSTLLHEIQHAIQQREGFAKGGNTDSYFTDRVRDALDKMEKEARQAVDYWKGLNKDKIDDAEKAAEVARYGLMWESAQRLIDYSKRDKPSGVFRLIRNEMQWIYAEDFRQNEAARELQYSFYGIPRSGQKRNNHIGDMAFRGARVLLDQIPADLREQFKADERTMKGMINALRRESDKKRKALAPLNELEGTVRRASSVSAAHRYSSSYEIYQALAGEIEARNTQKRQGMTDAERQATPPSATADVPIERTVVMFGGLDIRAPMASALDDGDQVQTLFQSQQMDEATGLPLNPDGTVTVYHHTSADKAKQITATGQLKSAAEPDVYVTTRRETDTGYGDTAVAIRVDPALLQIDDEFPDGRVDYRLSTGKPGGSIEVQVGEYPQQLNQAEGLDDKRGFIQFGANRKFNITLLEKANLSTFLHESGHFYLEVLGDLATAEGAPEQIRNDYATTLKFLGLESREQLTLDGKEKGSAEYNRAVEAHEKFARGFEAYLMEGNAPTPELQGIFQSFKSWLVMVYKQISALNVTLNNDVRGVFDRILASDAEIEAAKNEVNVKALLLDAAAAGMSPQEFELYRDSVAKATEAGKEALTAKLMRQLMRERKEWWKEASAKMREEVTLEVDSQPVYQAFKALVAGKMDDDTEIKLNKQSLIDKYGAEYVKRLPRGFARIYSAQGGMDADTAAEFLGYNSGDALIEALVGMRDRKELIAAETDLRMREVHGDMLTDGTIADEAKIALHNAQRENVLMTELRALRRKQREVAPFVQAERDKARQDRRNARAATEVPPAEAFRRVASGIIGQTSVRDTNPNGYLLASRKAARQAFEAMSKGDYMLAADAKQKELLNHYLYLEANKAKERQDKILKYAQKFEKGTTREQMGKAGGSYLEQIDAVLDRYEFRRVPLSKLDRRASLAEWIAEQEALGMEPAISAELLNESRRVNYRQISNDELNAVYDTVRNIEHLARLKNKLKTKQADIEFADAIGELVASAEVAGERKPLPLDMSAMTMREKAGDQVSRLDAMLLKMEQVVEWLDGGNVNGPWHTYIWNPISEAQNAEYDLTRKLTERLATSLEAMPKERRMAMLDTFEIPGMGKVTRKYLLSIAMNMGNQGNIDKMMRGMGWDMATIERGLAKLDDADWTFVQETWDTINSVWPDIAALEKRMTGIEPPKVEAQPYEVRDEQGNLTRTLAGGYYPLVYDPRLSEQGAKQESGNLGQLFEEGYVRATTPKGHTQARMEGFAAPMLLDFEQVITQHMAKVVKDLTHREAIVQANKILTNRDIRNVLQETMGPAYEKQMLPWLRSVVNDRNGGSAQGLSDFSRWMMTARANVVAATMGFKATTMIAQITGISQSLDKVKGRYLSQAVLDYLRHPVALTRQVRELSGEMRNRSNTLDRDIRDQLRNLTGQTSGYAQVQRFAFHGIAIMDTMVTVPTWLGAYRQAIAEGASEETAILEADAAVRMTQGAGGAKDLAAIQRNNELAKSVTMFYSYFSVLYNRMRDMGRDVQEIRDMPRFLSRMMFTVMVPAVLGELILGRGPDDDEDPAAWTIRKVLLYPMMSVPVLRDVVSSIDSGFDYRFSPLASVFDKIGKAATATGKMIEGDMEWGEYSVKVGETMGYVFGVAGTAQMAATGKYLWRVSEGEENPDNIAELLAYALLGKRKED